MLISGNNLIEGDDLMEINGREQRQLIYNRILNIKPAKGRYSAETQKLIKEIEGCIQELKSIQSYFDTISDPELVDYAIYKEKAESQRLSYLIRQAKQNNELLASIASSK